LGTALAGVSAILYACGYLIVRSQMSMLGVRELVEFGNERFLHEGATFVLSIAYTLLRPVLSIVVVLSVATLLIGLLWRVALRLDRGSRLSRAVDRMAAFVRRPAARRAAYAVALLALLLHASRYFNDYERPLAVVNMLFQPQKQPGELEALILAGNSTALHQRFQGLLWGAALAAMLTFVGWRVVSPLKLRGWLLLPFAVTSCLYLITLPMAYGVMQRPIEYARVSLAVEELGATMVGSLFLLERRSDGFVVWNRDVREVSWIPASKVRRVDVRAVEPLFTAPSGELK
jgi:hypothetical protein